MMVLIMHTGIVWFLSKAEDGWLSLFINWQQPDALLLIN